MLLIHLKKILTLVRLSPFLSSPVETGFVKLLPWGGEKIVREGGDLIQKPVADIHHF